MLLSAAPAFAASSEIEAIDIIFDTIILRPLGLVSTAFGGTFFLVSLPLSAITRSVGTSYDVLVKDPFNYTFVRPLGKTKRMN